MSDEANKVRILLVEDHHITRVGLKLALERFDDFSVVAECESGYEAIRMTESVKPDLILMDIGLPGISGIEAAATIKAATPGVKIVVFTSHDTDEDVAAAFAANCDGYCLKESDIRRIGDAIREVMRGNVWLDPAIARKVVQVFVGQRESAPAKTGESILSSRELQVLSLVVEGLSNQSIAERLNISAETVKTHMRRLMDKLSVSDRTQAAVMALRKGLI